jgi:hypothetical protein
MENSHIIIIALSIILGCMIISCAVIYSTNLNNNLNTVSIENNTTNNTSTNAVSNNNGNTHANQVSSSSNSNNAKSDSDFFNWDDDSGDVIYGHGEGSSDDPMIHWASNTKTGYGEYYNEHTGERSGGYNIA